MKMGPIEGSETSAFKPQTPGKYPKENILHKERGESLKSRQGGIGYNAGKEGKKEGRKKERNRERTNERTY